MSNETYSTTEMNKKFKEAIQDLFASNKVSPMYETYVNYALGINMRGDILAKELSDHISLEGKSYLDIGTAYGGSMVAFAKAGCKDIFGLEIDDRLVNICRLNLQENGLNPESVIRYDICQPLPDKLKKKFDIITCTDVLEHVLDIPSTINNIIALTTDSSHIYLEIPNRYHVNNVLSDPHFGLFGITLLDRDDAIKYFNTERGGEYLVGDYYNLEYFLSFFPNKFFRIVNISNPVLPAVSDELFLKEVKNTYLEKVSKLSVSDKLKRILIGRFNQYIIDYTTQMDNTDLNSFYVQSWKLIIHVNKYPNFDAVKKSDDILINSHFQKNHSKINESCDVPASFKLQHKEEHKEIEDLKNENANFKSQLEEKNLKINELQALNEDLKSQLENQKNEILDLKETLNQRESSLSWRFSQYYGKYFSIHSPVTKSISSFLNKIINSKESKPYSESSNEEKYLYGHELNNILEEHKDKIKGIIIYPPTIDWNIPLFQRPQQLALQFSKMGYLYFFSTESNKFDRVDGFRKIEDRCYVTNRYDLLIRELSEFIFLFSSTDLVLTLNDVQNIKNKALIIYEYIDEISEAISGASTDNIIRRHKYMIKNSDIVLATADKLFEDVIKIRQKDVYLNPNGVDYEHFHIVRDSENIPDEMKKIIKKGNPLIGYYGAFATWFDYKLIIELAEKRPNYEIVLIGWDYDNSMKNQKLDHYKNIHYLGVIKYPVLPEYAIWFDVAMIPFVLNKITESTSPIKIFEYMALGMPIVTTDMKECRKYKSVLIGKNYEEFIHKIDEGLELKKNNSYLDLLDKEAKENTWDMRAKKIDEYISLSKKN